jgi:hypothetical protein
MTVPVASDVSRIGLAERICEAPPSWAQNRLAGIGRQQLATLEPFVVHCAWTERGSVSLGRVVGVTRAHLAGWSWLEILRRRGGADLERLDGHPGLYAGARRKRGIAFLTLDRQRWWIEQGVGRAVAARFALHYQGIDRVDGIGRTCWTLDWEAWRLCQVLEVLCREQAPNTVVYPHCSLLTEALGDGWGEQRYFLSLAVREAEERAPRLLSVQEAQEWTMELRARRSRLFRWRPELRRAIA